MSAVSDVPAIDALDSPASALSCLYALVGECIEYPDAELVASIRDGRLARQLEQLLRYLDARLLEGIDLQPCADPGIELEPLAVEYTRLFDAGPKGTLCTLNGGLHVGPQMKMMEEAVRFYGHFGLTLTEEQKELPDHLTTQLNFLHFLAYGESVLQARGEPVTAYRLARRDFIARHPGRWLPLMQARLRAAQPLPLIQLWIDVLVRVLHWDLERLESGHGTASLAPSEQTPFQEI